MNLSNKYLKAWLTFIRSPTDDAKCNTWTTYGNPTIGTANAINGNALQLDGQSYIKLSNLTLGGQDFEIDGWVYVDSSSPNNARILSIVNPSNGNHLVTIRKNASDATKLDFWLNTTSDVSADNGYTYIANTNCVGERVYVKLIYRYSPYRMSLCINDIIVADCLATPRYNRQNFDIYIGALPNGNQGLIGSIDEVTIYDGTWFTYSYGDVPTADFYRQIQLDASTKLTVKNAPVTWRYENPGTADLLTQSGTTVTNLTESQSKTGTAFYQPTQAKCFDIPTTKEIWLKCDIYTTANYANNDRIRIYSKDSSGVNGWSTNATITSNYSLWHNGTYQTGGNYLGKNKIRSFLLHMKSDATNGVVEYFFSFSFSKGGTDKFVGNVNGGDNFANVYIQMDGSNILVSNLIISNAPLDIDENVAQLNQNIVDLNFDTSRRVNNVAENLSDTERKVVVPAEINFSTRREIIKSVILTSDTKRTINQTVDLYFDAKRNIFNAVEVLTDTRRKILKASEIDFDTQRKIEKYLTLNADTRRIINRTVDFIFDTERAIQTVTKTLVTAYFDALRATNKSFGVFFDTQRKLLKSAEIYFDGQRKIEKSVTLLNDLKRVTRNTADLNFDTKRRISNAVEINFDTQRNTQTVWRYENYGTATLLCSSGQTIPVPQTQSIYCIAFWSQDNFKCFDVPASNEVWIKFDAFAEKSFDVKNSTIDNLYYSGVTVVIDDQFGENYLNFFSGDYNQEVNYIWAKDTLHTCLLHMKSGEVDGLIEFWIDGVKQINFTGNVNEGADFTSLSITRKYGTANNNFVYAFSNVIISNAEIGFDENAKRPLTAYFDLLRDTGGEETDNTWRYENPGDTDSLLVEGADFTDLDKTQSKTGEAFSQTNKEKTFDIPATKELWIKFDFYIEDIDEFSANYHTVKNWGFAVQEVNQNVCGALVTAEGTSSGYVCYYSFSNSSNAYDGGNGYKSELNDLNTCLVHMKSGEEVGVIELWLNGELKYSKTGNVNNGADFQNICLRALSSNDVFEYKEVLFSSVIISNAEIGLDENYSFPVEFSADTERYLMPMFVGENWRYENYGTANLLKVSGITTELSKTASKYCAGFYSTAARQNYFGIPATKELWIKFDFYFNRNYETLFVGSLDNEKNNQVRLNCTGVSNDYARIIFALAEAVQSDTSNQFSSQQRYSAVLHLKSDSTNGKIELTVSDGNSLTYTGNVNNGNDFENVYIQGSNYNNISSYPLVSNVIISDTEVNISENAKMFSVYRYDSARNILLSDVEKFFDTKRNVISIKNIDADLFRNVIYAVNLDTDSSRDIQKPFQVNFDTARTMPHKIEVMPIPVADFSASLLRKNAPVRSATVTLSTENITFGLQSAEINLSAQQLTDQISYTSNIPVSIMEQVQGQYLDYKFDVRIEKIKRKGVLYSCQCCSDIDEILYRQIDYIIPEDEQWHRTDGKNYWGQPLPENEIARQKALADEPKVGLASSHIQKIAGVLGKTPILFFNEFTSTVDVESGGQTYQDLIGNIFGWTSRIPTLLINCFLRGDRLFVVQRGYEPNTIELTNSKHTLPIVEQEIMRTAWGANTWSKTETRTRKDNQLTFDHYDFAPDLPSSSGSSVSNKQSGYTYSNDGLVTQSVKEEGSRRIVTDYNYVTVGKRKYLSQEITTVYENEEVVDRTVTEKTYLGQGQSHSQTYDEGGDYLGGTVGQNTGNDRVTPFNTYNYKLGTYIYDEEGNRQYIEAAYYHYADIPEERTIHGIALFDTSFPVYGDERLAEITDAINWLNRKTQEKISMTVYDYPHLIDFTDKIIFEGNTYFLESNNALTNQRIINQQNVTFVRWF